jgi:hypothetical protein
MSGWPWLAASLRNERAPIAPPPTSLYLVLHPRVPMSHPLKTHHSPPADSRYIPGRIKGELWVASDDCGRKNCSKAVALRANCLLIVVPTTLIDGHIVAPLPAKSSKRCLRKHVEIKVSNTGDSPRSFWLRHVLAPEARSKPQNAIKNFLPPSTTYTNNHAPGTV